MNESLAKLVVNFSVWDFKRVDAEFYEASYNHHYLGSCLVLFSKRATVTCE